MATNTLISIRPHVTERVHAMQANKGRMHCAHSALWGIGTLVLMRRRWIVGGCCHLVSVLKLHIQTSAKSTGVVSAKMAPCSYSSRPLWLSAGLKGSPCFICSSQAHFMLLNHPSFIHRCKSADQKSTGGIHYDNLLAKDVGKQREKAFNLFTVLFMATSLTNFDDINSRPC